MTATGRFHQWHHPADDPAGQIVFPDGCRDVLIFHRADGADAIALTDLDHRPRHVDLTPGVSITGYRLRPGTVLPPDALAAIVAHPDQATEILGDILAATGESDIDTAIDALGRPGATVAQIARGFGVSSRTLQRHFLDRGQPPPDFWRRLARARRAAAMLTEATPLAEIAFAAGFSDQAHMTRDLVHWFGATPARLRRDRPALDLIRQPALGTWTGEHSSIR